MPMSASRLGQALAADAAAAGDRRGLVGRGRQPGRRVELLGGGPALDRQRVGRERCGADVTDNVTYVMEQVGHSDQDTRNRIYRHLIRERQQHGAAFDRVVAEARERFGEPAETGLKRVRNGSSAAIRGLAPRNG
jgi:hypothetical protein